MDELTDAVKKGNENNLPPMHKCKLGNHYISANVEIVRDPNFESGVVKIQRQGFDELNDAEKKHVNIWW